MAEAHPVAFQWVMEAKARGRDGHPRRPALQPHERARRPVRAAARRHATSRFSAGSSTTSCSTESDFREYVLAYTNAPTIIREEFQDAGRRRAVLRLSTRNSGSYDPTSWQYEGAFVGAAAGQRDQEGSLARRGTGGEGQAGRGRARHADARPDAASIRAASGRSSSAITPRTRRRWSSASAACRRTLFTRVCELFVENSGRERTTAFVHGVGWTQHTIGSPVHPRGLDPAAAARQHGPAGRRRHGDARPRVDPGIERHPDAVRHAPRLHPDAPRPCAP